jgi:isoleucyl-tRNA synthetase
MSARYLDILKDRLYVSLSDSPGRRSSQTVLFEVLSSLARVMAPILSFTAEEVWAAIPRGVNRTSVHLEEFPVPDPMYLDEELAKRWDDIFLIRSEVSRVLELARRNKVIGLSLDAAVELYLSDTWWDKLHAYREQLAEILIVSEVSLHPLKEVPEEAAVSEEVADIRIRVRPAEGNKCDRCWNYCLTVGEDSRHPAICSRCADVIRQLESPPA